MAAVMEVIDGVEYVTRIGLADFDANVALRPAVHLAPLVKLVRALPHIELFGCYECGNAVPANVQLLSGLATTSLNTPELSAVGW